MQCQWHMFPRELIFMYPRALIWTGTVARARKWIRVAVATSQRARHVFDWVAPAHTPNGQSTRAVGRKVVVGILEKRAECHLQTLARNRFAASAAIPHCASFPRLPSPKSAHVASPELAGNLSRRWQSCDAKRDLRRADHSDKGCRERPVRLGRTGMANFNRGCRSCTRMSRTESISGSDARHCLLHKHAVMHSCE